MLLRNLCLFGRAGGRGKPRERLASASVELAILLPFIVPFLLGVWEVGRLVEVEQILSNAVREGGRQISTGKRSVAQIKADVVNYLKHNGIQADPNDVTIVNQTSSARPEPTQAEQGDEFLISVEIPFDSVRWILLDQITDVKSLYSSTTWYSMRDIPIEVNADIPLE
jgi:hypothetical protein